MEKIAKTPYNPSTVRVPDPRTPPSKRFGRDSSRGQTFLFVILWIRTWEGVGEREFPVAEILKPRGFSKSDWILGSNPT